MKKIFEDIEFHGTVNVKQAVNIDKPINGVKIYRALLRQSSTNDPVATVLENSIGDIVWTRDGVGTYKGTLAGAFTADKTSLMMNPLGYDWQVDQNLYWNTVNDLIVATTNRINAYSDGVLGNGLSTIEIRVYE